METLRIRRPSTIKAVNQLEAKREDHGKTAFAVCRHHAKRSCPRCSHSGLL